MAKIKTEFDLETPDGGKLVNSGSIEIVGKTPHESTYVAISVPGTHYHFIKDKDLERFAVNILKALDSDAIKPLWARKGKWGKKKDKEFKKSKHLKP